MSKYIPCGEIKYFNIPPFLFFPFSLFPFPHFSFYSLTTPTHIPIKFFHVHVYAWGIVLYNVAAGETITKCRTRKPYRYERVIINARRKRQLTGCLILQLSGALQNERAKRATRRGRTARRAGRKRNEGKLPIRQKHFLTVVLYR